ncbi:hypothetical protein KKC47_04630 [Patescibacteria group bacterium]|nr:hypothetical protein [Patescibacteria group bacterium]
MNNYLEIILFVTVFFIVGSAAYGATVGAPWVPTKREVRKRALQAVKLKNTDTIYDLGSGNGSLLFEAARKYPQCRAIGLELFILPYLYARLRKSLARKRYHRVKFLYRDLFLFNISDADVVFVFLMPGCYKRLVKKFRRELNDHCRVIIEAWPFADIEPLAVIGKNSDHLPLYLYHGRQFREDKNIKKSG